MVKKIFSIVLCFSLFMAISTTAYASTDSTSNQVVERLSNGNYIVSEISEEQNESISLYTSTVTKTKTNTCYSSSGIKLWSVSVTGTFTYGNGTSKCNSVSCSSSVYDTSWSVGNKKASKSGNKATASATGEQYINGYISQTLTRTVTLTCSPTGQFS